MAKRGRPFMKPEDKVKNKIISVDEKDYKKIKIHSIETKTKIKAIIHNLVENLD